MLLYIWRWFDPPDPVYETRDGKVYKGSDGKVYRLADTVQQTAGYRKIMALDYASSVIWVSRYNAVGDFEIYARANRALINALYAYPDDCIITRDDSDTAMIIEKMKVRTDPENGDYITVSGRSAESLLDRRIAVQWYADKNSYLLNFSGTAENLMRQLITDNIISPYETSRKINGFSLGTAKGYTDTTEAQLLGENLLETVQALCKQFGYGFRIRFDGEFKFELYKGTDRSRNQTENPRVIFSPQMQNISYVEWELDKSPMKTCSYIGGEIHDNERYKQVVAKYSFAGFPDERRREIWCDGSGLSSKLDDDSYMTYDEYAALLKDAGKTQLAENRWHFSMETEAFQSAGCTYGVDFFLGDFVTCSDSYGLTADSRVSEITEVEDDTGYSLIPKFMYWE
jgi:hypothetical protein